MHHRRFPDRLLDRAGDVDHNNGDALSYVLRHELDEHLLHLRSRFWAVSAAGRRGYWAWSLVPEPEDAINAKAFGFQIGRVEPLKLTLDRSPYLNMIIALQLAENFDGRNRDRYVRPFIGDHMRFGFNADPERLQRRTHEVNEMISASFLRAGVRRACMLIEIPEALEDIGVGSGDAMFQVMEVGDQERMQIGRGGRAPILQRGQYG
jgi:hypothetical protein